ncbi:MAG: retroviral-like aspartic protease family protein [bacterium]
MGEVVTKIKVSHLANKKFVEIETLVDTGATYTVIPSKILEDLNISKIRRINVEFANGEVEERDMGDVYIELENVRVPNQIIFGKEKDAIVLGLITIESAGMTVDPINRKLLFLPKIHCYKNG